MRGNNRFAIRFPLIAAALLVCSISVYGQSGPAASVISVYGQVSVLRDGLPWALNTGNTVQPRQIIETGPGAYAEFRVSDGSTFEVFENSHVTFRESPPSWEQLLDVLIGRIKVSIQHLAGQPNPNNVRTPTALISVRGTKFFVVVENNGDATFVSVDEGKVEVENLTASPGKTRYINPGESIRIEKGVPLAKSLVDKGSVAQGAMKAAAQAMYEILLRTARNGGATPGGTGGGVGTIGQGDKKSPAPPPSAPPPPPPPPPAQ